MRRLQRNQARAYTRTSKTSTRSRRRCAPSPSAISPPATGPTPSIHSQWLAWPSTYPRAKKPPVGNHCIQCRNLFVRYSHCQQGAVFHSDCCLLCPINRSLSVTCIRSSSGTCSCSRLLFVELVIRTLNLISDS